MAVYSLKSVQTIPASVEALWNFFSDPEKLPVITPPNLGFKIISQHHGDHLYAGQIIEYIVKPILGIPLHWMTEITHVEHHKYFVDEQRQGPYSLWHHQHFFAAVKDGVEMTDIVHYKVPFGFIGNWANALLVQKSLREIFTYRYQKIEALYGKWPSQQMSISFHKTSKVHK
ncbi:SRPBCC family protein [Pinibacter aurantiacus]|uniref:SRPBCC family protein n=1 Tax=Pinibacter aurantiacus TaxID=2851599 RepID=A0A9E2W3B0_9BACT|nr:SRPBCC family protein [Pinibacter aurantiacus]MBV4356614.1 SRPBCC family protein [Pinibacter aurantiacus]